jgi:hypothetical protein
MTRGLQGLDLKAATFGQPNAQYSFSRHVSFYGFLLPFSKMTVILIRCFFRFSISFHKKTRELMGLPQILLHTTLGLTYVNIYSVLNIREKNKGLSDFERYKGKIRNVFGVTKYLYHSAKVSTKTEVYKFTEMILFQ